MMDRSLCILKFVVRSAFILIVHMGLLLPSAVSASPFQTETDVLTVDDSQQSQIGFSFSVDISNDTIVAGAIDDSEFADEGGAAYVFQKSGHSWVQQIKLVTSDVAVLDHTGYSVGIDGNWIVLGAPRNESSFWNIGLGKAYVFKRDGNTWLEHEKLFSTGGFGDFNYGVTVDISGDVLVIGAPGHHGTLGHAYVFRLNGTNWIEEAALVGLDTQIDDGFGKSVSIDQNLIAVGAFDSQTGTDAGSCYVFRHNGTSWVQEDKVTASDISEGEFFGNSVAIKGSDLVVGAFGDNSVASNSGAAYVYRYDGAHWPEVTKLTASDGAQDDWFGRSVAVNGDTLIVGANGYDRTCAGEFECDEGQVYLFRRIGSQWVEQNRLIASNPIRGELLGYSIAFGDDLIVSAAPFGDHVYIYTLPAPIPVLSTWGLSILFLMLLISGTIYARKHASLLGCLVVLLMPVISVAQPPDLSVPHHPEQLLVRFMLGTPAQERANIHSAIGATHLKNYRYVDGLTLIRVPAARLENALERYINNPNILYAEEDHGEIIFDRKETS